MHDPRGGMGCGFCGIYAVSLLLNRFVFINCANQHFRFLFFPLSVFGKILKPFSGLGKFDCLGNQKTKLYIFFKKDQLRMG